MNKKIFVLGAAVLLSASAYGQRPLKMAKVTEAITGGVASAFSENVPVTVLNAEMLGNYVRRAQIAATPQMYVSSAQLFKRVKAKEGFKNMDPQDVALLEKKFSQLDEVVKLQTAAFAGYRGALWSAKPAKHAEVLLHPQVTEMIEVLELQRYMQGNRNQFPQLFTIAPGGWLIVTDVWTSRQGNEAIRQVLDILVKQQAGQAAPDVVAQLVTLYAGAENPVPVETVVEQLQNWRAAHNTDTLAPQLPTDLGAAASLRANAENLWLSINIRLLQLTPGLELPQILKDAKVTQ